MQIEQIVIEYDSIEDRLLMSIHIDGPSVRIWITRRYVCLLRTALGEIFSEQQNMLQPLVAESSTLLAELMHQKAISSIDLKTPPISRHNENFKTQSSEAFDTTSVNTNIKKMDDAWVAFQLQTVWDETQKTHRKATGIIIAPQLGSGITFNLDDKLPHALIQMLARACESAQWDLDFTPLGANAMQNQFMSKNVQVH